MNLGRVDFITNQEYDLFIRPDTANPRARYNFSFFISDWTATAPGRQFFLVPGNDILKLGTK